MQAQLVKYTFFSISFKYSCCWENLPSISAFMLEGNIIIFKISFQTEGEM